MINLNTQELKDEYFLIKEKNHEIFNNLLNLMKTYNQRKYCGNYCFESINAPNDIRLYDKQINYYGICKNIKPNKILEIGINACHSILISILANPSVKIFANDICYFNYTVPCVSYLNSIFDDKITLLKGDSKNILYEMKKNKMFSFDLIHIDATHEYENVYMDINNIIPMCHKNSLIVVDDYEGAVKNASDDLVKEGKIKYNNEFTLRFMKNWPHNIFTPII